MPPLRRRATPMSFNSARYINSCSSQQNRRLFILRKSPITRGHAKHLARDLILIAILVLSSDKGGLVLALGRLFILRSRFSVEWPRVRFPQMMQSPLFGGRAPAPLRKGD